MKRNLLFGIITVLATIICSCQRIDHEREICAWGDDLKFGMTREEVAQSKLFVNDTTDHEKYRDLEGKTIYLEYEEIYHPEYMNTMTNSICYSSFLKQMYKETGEPKYPVAHCKAVFNEKGELQKVILYSTLIFLKDLMPLDKRKEKDLDESCKIIQYKLTSIYGQPNDWILGCTWQYGDKCIELHQGYKVYHVPDKEKPLSYCGYYSLEITNEEYSGYIRTDEKWKLSNSVW